MTTPDGSPQARSPDRPARGAGRVPDFFIAGHAKCGTSAIYRMLRQHPQVFMAVKEPRYFAPELRSRFRRVAPQSGADTLAAYMALFAGAEPDQLAGEATPSYLRSHEAAARIAEANPQARIVALFREPASYLRSFHQQALFNNFESETDLRKALALEAARRGGRRMPLLSQSPQSLLYMDHVKYVEQLRRYEAVFPRGQILTLIYEDFRADNEAVVRQILRFLQLDDTVDLKPIRTPPVPAVRSPLAQQLLWLVTNLSHRLGRGERSGRTTAVLRRLAHGEQHPPTDEQLMGELRARLKGEVVALGEHLGLDLISRWGYEDVG
jgi:Sulfotransferase family